MKWIVLATFAGWAAIVRLAWVLADRRIGQCYELDTDCELRATAARDAVLTGGLTVALVAGFALAVVWWIARQRLNRSNGSVTIQAARQRLP